jgi:hypothetical protein
VNTLWKNRWDFVKPADIMQSDALPWRYDTVPFNKSADKTQDASNPIEDLKYLDVRAARHFNELLEQRSVSSNLVTLSNGETVLMLPRSSSAYKYFNELAMQNLSMRDERMKFLAKYEIRLAFGAELQEARAIQQREKLDQKAKKRKRQVKEEYNNTSLPDTLKFLL